MADYGKTVFEYEYVPRTCQHHPNDGGFRVTLGDRGVLWFDALDPRQQTLYRLTFQLPEEVSARVRRMIARNTGWIMSLQKNRTTWFRTGGEPSFISNIRLEEYAFCLEDIPQLMNCPFRQRRGHYTHLMYTLVEDVSSVFLRCGVNLLLNGFDWDRSMLTPLEWLSQQQEAPVQREQTGPWAGFGA